ncbi:MAG: hypothetical protein ACI4RD_00975 [Kiritimatiellia bacterium]
MRKFTAGLLGCVAAWQLTAAPQGDVSAVAPFTQKESLPAAHVDDLALRQWRFRAQRVDWELKRTFAGRDYAVCLKYPATGARPSAAGGEFCLNEYNLFNPLDAWIPPAIGAKAQMVTLAVRTALLAGGASAELRLRQAKCLAGNAFTRRVPLAGADAVRGEWTELSFPVDLVPGNRLCDLAVIFVGAATNAVCELAVADVQIRCRDGAEYAVVNPHAPSYLEGLEPSARRPPPFRALPMRPLVQLGIGAWTVIAGREELARLGAWGRKYCPEFDIVLSLGGSPEPCLRDLHALLPDNVYLQFQKAGHARAYPALFDALPRNERGEAQNFAFNSVIATHPMIRQALDEQLVYAATLGFSNFQSYDYVWLYKDGRWGYDAATVAAFREDLSGRGEKLELTDGRRIDFAGYYAAYHGVPPQPGDFGWRDWDEFRPEADAVYLRGGATGSRRYELFAMLRHYEWLLQAQRWNHRAAGYGGRYDYLLNGESWVNANDHLFLLKLKHTGIVSPEFFSHSPKALDANYHRLGLFVREAKRGGKRFGMTVETSRGGGDSQPYWSPRTGFALCYALAGIGLDSFEYDHVSVCSIWSPEACRRYHPAGNYAYAQATERHLLGDLRGYRRARLDGATRPDATAALVLGRRPVGRAKETVDWPATLDRLGYDYAFTDIVELPELLDGARVVFVGDEARRPGVRRLLDAWLARGEGRTLFADPQAAELSARLAALDLPRRRTGGTDASAIALRFATRCGESAVLFDRRAVAAADRDAWYREKWAPTFHRFVAEERDYLYPDVCSGGVCRVTFDVPVRGAYRVYRYLADREELADAADGTLTLDNSGHFCEVCYFAPDTAEFLAFLDEVKADRAVTADAFASGPGNDCR